MGIHTMTISGEVGSFLAEFYLTMKTEAIEWQKAHQAEIVKLKEEKVLSKKKLTEQIEKMEVRFQGHKQRLQLNEERKTQEFIDFLDSIKDTKQKMLEFYPHMPKPMALLIHHHAAELLQDAWNSPNFQTAFKKQAKFMELMEHVSDDFVELEEGKTRKFRPERTIKFIKDETT